MALGAIAPPAAAASPHHIDAGSTELHAPLTPSKFNPSREARSLGNGLHHTGGRSSSPPSQNDSHNCTSSIPDIFEKYCSCNGTRVNCDFSVNRQITTITEDNFRIPPHTNSLHVVLGVGTNFILKSGIFKSAKINDLLIVGHLRGEQVEITSNVFEDHGPYPDVNITDCGSVIIRTNAFLTGESKLTIQRSNDVIISQHAFYNTNLRATFKDIKDLRIEEQSFNLVSLDVISSNLNNLYGFKGRPRVVRFFNCTIGIVNSDTFDVHTIDSLSFEECKIGTIKSRVFPEKLASDIIQITRSTIETIESEAFAGSGISHLVLTENRINTIQANAIRVIAANVAIEKNEILDTYHNWFDVSESSHINIVSNAFGSFAPINIGSSRGAQSAACKFEGNSIHKPLTRSLNLLHPFCRIRKVSVDYPCNCNTSWLEHLSDRDLRSESYCRIENPLQSCFNSTLLNVLTYLKEICDESKQEIHCKRKNEELLRVNGHFITREELEKVSAKDYRLILIVIAVICIVILCLIIAYMLCHRSRKASGGKFCDHSHEFTGKDLEIIDQARKLMKLKYPQQYKIHETDFNKFLRPNLSQNDCMDITTKIACFINTSMQARRDFEKLNELLYNHSARGAPTSDPIYAEPTAPLESAYDRTEQTSREHIYAEPGGTQQPLLGSEYSSPSDRHEDQGGLYSEPIYNGGITPQPSFVTTKLIQLPEPRVQQQQPSTSHNLPDVIDQPSRGTHKKPMTNVKKIAQNLESNPQFSGRPPINAPLYTEVDSSRKGLRKPFTGIVDRTVPTIERRRNTGNNSSSDAGSDHSGGSDVTMKIDDIEYADA